MIFLMRCLIVTDDTCSPNELLMPLWKKYFHFIHALRGVHVLVVDHAGHGGLVHPDVVGDVAQDQRPQVLDAVIQERVLEIDDARRDLDDRLLPLVRPTSEPERGAELVLHVGARLVGRLAALVQQPAVHRTDAQLRQAVFVQHGLVALRPS
jgi:hypothetical protein